MQILLALIVGAVFGIAAHYAAPGRDTRGVAVGPVIGAIVGGVVWLIFTWAGVGIDNPWIWLVSFIAPFPIVYPILRVLGGVRRARDTRERARLRIS
ncbi:hypothetical protein [Microbacterium rhizomatis]|uniref:GlsB/YeaQ/YmgE family stress response membrane protein n=1 Tax=Microbacterium rhizomatis TaxID=1631477 RepID=A0A5J5J648_9MICO|nr:hypothetical protein [Microbacterium rhizomatis]KAA9110263.1 hypothetical protein F6B43_00740 [Microbacterium rhizomatis]